MPYSDLRDAWDDFDPRYSEPTPPPEPERPIQDWYNKNISPIGDQFSEYLKRSGEALARIPQDISKNVAIPFLQQREQVHSTDWSKQPFIGIGEHGEFTGRLPALASYVTPYLLGAAPAGSLSAGAKLPGGTYYGYPEGLEGGYHGTPHRFAPTPENVLGQFKPEAFRSGTGGLSEGAGFYIASRRNVGEEYKDLTTGGLRNQVLNKEGYPVQGMQLAEKYYEPGQIVPLGSGYGRVVEFRKPTNPDTAKYWSAEIQPVTRSDKAIEQGISSYEAMHDPSLWDDLARSMTTRRDEPSGMDMDMVGKARGWETGDPGSLYHVEIKPPEESILHWNRAFSEQTPEVRERLKEVLKKQGYGDNRLADLEANNPTGKDIYNSLVDEVSPSHRHIGGDREMTEAKTAVSKMFDEAGIPGLKYHDDFSVPNITFNGVKMEGYDDFLKALDIKKSPEGFEPRLEALGEVLENNGNINESIASLKRSLSYLKSDPENYGYSNQGWYRYTEEGLEESIKWLEQNRDKIGKDTSQYEHNYVIFDPRHLNIVHREKNELGGKYLGYLP